MNSGRKYFNLITTVERCPLMPTGMIFSIIKMVDYGWWITYTDLLEKPKWRNKSADLRNLIRCWQNTTSRISRRGQERSDYNSVEQSALRGVVCLPNSSDAFRQNGTELYSFDWISSKNSNQQVFIAFQTKVEPILLPLSVNGFFTWN